MPRTDPSRNLEAHEANRQAIAGLGRSVLFTLQTRRDGLAMIANR
jgi:hypothetical protein